MFSALRTTLFVLIVELALLIDAFPVLLLVNSRESMTVPNAELRNQLDGWDDAELYDTSADLLPTELPRKRSLGRPDFILPEMHREEKRFERAQKIALLLSPKDPPFVRFG
ncbi:hypothetical protein AAVH_11915 [Aphelenchoides avenae]|nr:hypothetical protein AAVH_11915 [Aphelenchus avenae]